MQGVNGVISPVIRGNGKVIGETSRDLVNNFRAIFQPGLKDSTTWYNLKEKDKRYHKFYKIPINTLLAPVRTVGTIATGALKVVDNTILKPIENTGHVISLGSSDMVNILRDPFDQSMEKKYINDFKFSKAHFEEEAYLKLALERLEEEKKILQAKQQLFASDTSNRKLAQDTYNQRNQDMLDLKKNDIKNNTDIQTKLIEIEEENKRLQQQIDELKQKKAETKQQTRETKTNQAERESDDQVHQHEQKTKLQDKEKENREKIETNETVQALSREADKYNKQINTYNRLYSKLGRYQIKYAQEFADAKANGTFDVVQFKTEMKNTIDMLRQGKRDLAQDLANATDAEDKIDILETKIEEFQETCEEMDTKIVEMKDILPPKVNINVTQQYHNVKKRFSKNIRVKRK